MTTEWAPVAPVKTSRSLETELPAVGVTSSPDVPGEKKRYTVETIPPSASRPICLECWDSQSLTFLSG